MMLKPGLTLPLSRRAFMAEARLTVHVFLFFLLSGELPEGGKETMLEATTAPAPAPSPSSLAPPASAAGNEKGAMIDPRTVGVVGAAAAATAAAAVLGDAVPIVSVFGCLIPVIA